METKAIKESQSFCTFCRISLSTKEEKILGYHEACKSEMNEFKEEMGIWYYLQLVNATEADYEADAKGNILSLDLSNKRLFDIPELPFKDLQYIDVSYNHLSSIPPWIYELPSLDTMVFPGNGFNQSLVYDMLRLNEKGVNIVSTGLKFHNHRLITVNFTYVGSYLGAHLLDFPDEVAKYFSTVETVDISHNGLRKLPEWVYTIKGLKELIVAGNNLTLTELKKIRNFKKLKSLRMSRSSLSREQEKIIEELQSNGVIISNYEPRYFWWSNDNDF